MFEDFLEIGMKVIIEVKRENDTDMFFNSKIEDITTNEVILDMPMKGGITYSIDIDEDINIYFSRKDSFYCIEGKVTDRQYVPIPIIKMLPLSSPYKKQKRNYFRLKISLPINVKISGTGETFSRYTRDISAGGIKFSHSDLIELGTMLEVAIPDILGDDTAIKAKVIRTEHDDRRKINRYDIAIEFEEVDERTRDIIIKFILAKQRELRKNGLE